MRTAVCACSPSRSTIRVDQREAGQGDTFEGFGAEGYEMSAHCSRRINRHTAEQLSTRRGYGSTAPLAVRAPSAVNQASDIRSAVAGGTLDRD